MTDFRKIFGIAIPRTDTERTRALEVVRSKVLALREAATRAVEEEKVGDAVEATRVYNEAIEEARKQWPTEKFLTRGD